MVRRVIKIDEEKCNGCGLCAKACHEGAIGIINNKARLLRDDYCDGLGDCLPVCPTGAISFEEREAAGYDAEAVKANMAKRKAAQHMGGCPGSKMKAIVRTESKSVNEPANIHNESRLMQWPVQIKLVPVKAPYFDGSKLLIAADCTAYAYGNFHDRFIKNHITIIGCPKLDECDYADKLGAIIAGNDIKSITVVRMEVPCCGGIANAAARALKDSGKIIPFNIVTISADGEIIEG